MTDHTQATLARLLEAIDMDDHGDNRSEVLAALQDLQTLIERGGRIPYLATPINRHPSLLFPWNRKGAAREHVLAFLALAEAEAQAALVTPADVAGARLTLAWLRRLADMQRDDLP